MSFIDGWGKDEETLLILSLSSGLNKDEIALMNHMISFLKSKDKDNYSSFMSIFQKVNSFYVRSLEIETSKHRNHYADILNGMGMSGTGSTPFKVMNYAKFMKDFFYNGLSVASNAQTSAVKDFAKMYIKNKNNSDLNSWIVKNDLVKFFMDLEEYYNK